MVLRKGGLEDRGSRPTLVPKIDFPWTYRSSFVREAGLVVVLDIMICKG